MTSEERYKRIEQKFGTLEKDLSLISQNAIDHMKHKPYSFVHKGPRQKVYVKKGVNNNE